MHWPVDSLSSFELNYNFTCVCRKCQIQMAIPSLQRYGADRAVAGRDRLLLANGDVAQETPPPIDDPIERILGRRRMFQTLPRQLPAVTANSPDALDRPQPRVLFHPQVQFPL